jgi:hypothetical protein
MKITQALTDSKAAVFAQNPHFIITAEVSTLVCIKIFNSQNVNQIFTLKDLVLNVLKYITILSLSKHFSGDDDASRMSGACGTWRVGVFFTTSCNVLNSVPDIRGTDMQQERRKPPTAPSGMHILFKTLYRGAKRTTTGHIPHALDILVFKILSVVTFKVFNIVNTLKCFDCDKKK